MRLIRSALLYISLALGANAAFADVSDLMALREGDTAQLFDAKARSCCSAKRSSAVGAASRMKRTRVVDYYFTISVFDDAKNPQSYIPQL